MGFGDLGVLVFRVRCSALRSLGLQGYALSV